MPEKQLIIVPTEVPKCPYCGRASNCLGGNIKHRKGDLAICWGCRQTAMIEVDPLRLRKPYGHVEEELCEGAFKQILSDG